MLQNPCCSTSQTKDFECLDLPGGRLSGLCVRRPQTHFLRHGQKLGCTNMLLRGFKIKDKLSQRSPKKDLFNLA